MKNKDFKKMFLQESENIVIKMSDKLQKTHIQALPESQYSKADKKSPFLKRLIPITATFCCLIVALSIFIINSATGGGYLTAYAIEINPSICITTDANDKIINICSLNEDADEILSDIEFENIVGENIETAIEKIIKTVSEKGILDDYQNEIRVYALNDDKGVMDKKLKKVGDIVDKKLKEFGHEDIKVAKSEMTLNDFKDKMGFDGNFKRLDDMQKDIKEHGIFNDDVPPPKPEGSNPYENQDNPPPKPEEDVPPPANQGNPPINNK